MTFKNFLTEAGKVGEEQEQAIVNLVKKLTNKGSNLISLKVGNKILPDVVSISKYGKMTIHSKEPITDLVIELSSGKKINVSAKGLTSPSLAGGGLKGLNYIVAPEIKKFLERAEEYYIDNGFVEGDTDLPEVSALVAEEIEEKIIRSDASQGGPIDYIYIGPKQVVSYNIELFNKSRILELNGIFYTPKQLAKKYSLYYVLRRRIGNAPFAPGKKDKDGLPIIFAPTARISVKTGMEKIEGSPRRIIIYPKQRGILIDI